MFKIKIKKCFFCLPLFFFISASNFCYSSERNEKIEIIDIDSSNYRTEPSCGWLYDILDLKKEVFKSNKKVCDDLSEIISIFEDKTRRYHILGLYIHGINNFECGAIVENFENGDVFLRYIFTKKNDQRKGYGKRIMNYIKNMVKKGRSIKLESTYDSVGFYEKCEFKKIGISQMALTVFEWKNDS